MSFAAINSTGVVTRRQSNRSSMKQESSDATEASFEDTLEGNLSRTQNRMGAQDATQSYQQSTHPPCHRPCALVPARLRQEATRLMAMNELVRNRAPTAPSINEVIQLANSIGASLGNNPEYKRSARERTSIARPNASTIPAIPQVTTNLRPEDIPRSPVYMQIPVVSQLRGIGRTSDNGSIHDPPPASPSPIDAVAAFLNGRPIPSTGAAQHEWSLSESEAEQPPAVDNHAMVLTNILDAIRQGVEIYARVASTP
ncbi:hypothetical protein LTR84_007679 [Exophiala bonariae]|uniref:Uncharacterized protein n=1 Tax=Exophiala bonariae TaxID=1690606 RepID=A0AAV9NPI5_9EURO|nr:hypothetical protein LTR84_007679 [Exophiala bonariae]